MKQGSAPSKPGSRKIEPRSKAVNPHKVADIGIQTVRTRPHANLGRGYKAPGPSATAKHPSGSQGKR